MAAKVRVVQVGFGPLGQMLLPYLLERSHLEIVGVVDIDPKIVGQDVADLCEADLSQPLRVVSKLAEAPKADVAVVTTVSEINALAPFLKEAFDLGLKVVSTCEELSYPWHTNRAVASEIDQIAKAKNCAVLGTGVNPGFLMDFLPTTVTAVCRNVTRISVHRIQDASYRRSPFRQKIGAGLTREEFEKRVETKKIRHVGLIESMQMIAARLGWKLDRTEEFVKPVIAKKEISGQDFSVPAGHAVGINQQSRAFQGDQERVHLEFRATVGETDPHDRIHIEGTPSFDMVVPGGIHGDIATCAVVTNAIEVVARATPGLHNMTDLPAIASRA